MTNAAALRYAVNCSILFTELPLLERPMAAQAAGFDAVEFWWPFADAVPADAAVEAFVGAVRSAGVRLAALNLFAGDMPAGDRGVLSWPARSAEFRDNVDVVVSIAGQLGCSAFNALYGSRIDGLAPAAQDELATENLALAARAVARVGGTVLIEPLSGIASYPLRMAADAIAVVDRVQAVAGVSNIALLADLYHLAANDDDVDKVIGNCAGRIGHVQIADHPGRHQPGSGRLPWQRYLASLTAQGYGGWVALEYVPTGPTGDSFGWLPLPCRRSGSGNDEVETRG
jgi:hydroxypyruvate isomerase